MPVTPFKEVSKILKMFYNQASNSVEQRATYKGLSPPQVKMGKVSAF